MSWHFSRALVAAFSEADFWDGEPSAPSRSTLTAETYSWLDKTTDRLSRSRSGMTCEPLTVGHGAGVLMWCLEDSRVRTSAPRTPSPKESPGREAASGLRWPASLAKYDPASSSWKTSQPSLLGDSASFSETWPRWGSMRSGACWERTMPELPTSEIDSGSWLATPTATATATATANQNCPSMQKWQGCRNWLPTPSASAYGTNQGGSAGRVGPVRPSLQTMASRAMWPTPTRHNAKEGAYPAEFDRNTPTLPASAGGKLNPAWVESLMMWPIGWTDCAQSATGRFQQWLRLLGGHFPRG